MASTEKFTAKDGTVSYRIRVLAGTRADGKQARKTTTFTPPPGLTPKQAEKAAKRFADEFEQQVRNGGLAPENFTVDELLQKWLHEHCETQLKPNTVAGYRQRLPRISAALGHIHVNKLNAGHIAQFYKQLAQPGIRIDGKYKAFAAFTAAFPKGKRKALLAAAGCCDRTGARIWGGKSTTLKTAQRLADAAGWQFSRAFYNVNKSETLGENAQRGYHRCLNACFTWAVRRGLMQENVCQRVDPPKVRQQEVTFLDEHGVAVLLAALPNAPTQFSVITQLALFTGARRGEICGLRWSDIDLERGTIAFRRARQYVRGYGLIFETPKTNKSRRVIRLDDNAIQLLRDYRQWQNRERLRLGGAYARTVDCMGEKVQNDFLFTKPNGQPLDPSAVTTWFSRFVQEQGLPPCHFHSLRHSNAALLIGCHVPITTVSGRLGHAQVSTTLNVYAGAIQTADAAAADALTETFNRILNADIG